MKLVSTDLGTVLRVAFNEFKAQRINRCVWTHGRWYVYL